MRIKPVAFNYADMKKQVPNLEITFGRRNVVLKNEKYTMWGEDIDREKGIMGLTSVSLSREFSKGTKHDIYTEWESFLGQFSEALPEEISAKLAERAKKQEDMDIPEESATA